MIVKVKGIIDKIKKSYEVEAPEILSRLSFSQNETVSQFPQKKYVPLKRIIACCASLALAIGIGVVSVMHFNIDNNNKPPLNTNALQNTGMSGITGNETNNTPNSNSTIIEAPKVSYDIPYSSDYIWTSVEDLYKNADLVIIGDYKETKDTYYAKDRGRLITSGTVEIETVIKGDLTEMSFETEEIEYYGGKMSVSEFIKQNGKEVTKQYVNDNFEEQEVRERYIGEKSSTSVNAKEGHKYLIFLNYDKDSDRYFVCSDSYGMRELNDEGKAWNPDLAAFENITIIGGIKR